MVGALPFKVIVLPLIFIGVFAWIRLTYGAVMFGVSVPEDATLLCLYFTMIRVIIAPLGICAWKLYAVIVDGLFNGCVFPCIVDVWA